MDRNTLEDLASTPEFQMLSVEALGKPERAMGESIIEAQPPNWKEVARLALDLTNQEPLHLPTRIYFTKAKVNTHGFDGLNEALAGINELLSNQWGELYPFEDTDDPDDPWYERVNLVREISEDPGFIDGLRSAPLFSVRGIGTYSARDLDITAGVVRAEPEESEHCQEGLLKGALSELGSEAVQSLQATLVSCSEQVQQLVATLESNQIHTANDLLKPLGECTSQALARFEEYAREQLQQVSVVDGGEGAVGTVASQTDEIDGAVSDLGSTAQPSMATSSLGSRADAIATFNRIIAYYQHNEPASPVAIFAERARDLVPKNFFEVLNDLAPGNDGNLEGCLEALQGQPLKFLLADSFQRHVSGGHSPNSENMNGALPEPSLATREDVMKELSNIESYFRQQEPASPIPLLIAEMRRLVPRSFTELLNEFAKVTADRGTQTEVEPEAG